MNLQKTIKFFKTYCNRILDYKNLVLVRKITVVIALLSFFVALLFSFLYNNGILSHELFPEQFKSYYFAFYISFSFVLTWEVLAMIYTIPYSIADAVGKQFEIMSLIIIRYIFEHLGRYSHFHSLKEDWTLILELSISAFGALLLFLLTLHYYKIQPHKSISEDPSDTKEFIFIKKLVSVILIFILLGFAMSEFMHVLHTIWINDFKNIELSHIFFKEMFSIMVFFDILLILLTLWYGSRYQVVFRTTALTISTILIRLSFSEDIYITISLSILAALFAIGTTYVYTIYDRNPPYNNKLKSKILK